MSPWNVGGPIVIDNTEYILKVPGQVTIYATDSVGNRGPVYTVGGDPPGYGIWNDNDDATYVEGETFEHPDVSYADGASGRLEKRFVPTDPTKWDVWVRCRFHFLRGYDGRIPSMQVPRGTYYDDGQPQRDMFGIQWAERKINFANNSDKQRTMYEFGGTDTFGNVTHSNLTLMTPYLRKNSYAYPHTRFMEGHVIIRPVDWTP